ncbi:MAG TPA: hypothetical protein VGG64_13545 [Pirellulales bacterium]|jgi:hypothetical protein
MDDLRKEVVERVEKVAGVLESLMLLGVELQGLLECVGRLEARCGKLEDKVRAMQSAARK